MIEGKKQAMVISLTTFGFFGLVISGLIIGVFVLVLMGCLIYVVSEVIPAEMYMIIILPLLTSLLLLYIYIQCGERVKKINDAFLFFVAALKAMQLAGESIGYSFSTGNYNPLPDGMGMLVILSISAILKAMISFLEIFKNEDRIVIWFKRKIKLPESKKD
ncbi:hypothetical protein [Klebsiella michiganensis]|uniref:hypothetical protein n=1 Tax=Klebsiella michiganensis TaxID=1134687 RepID=UPI001560F5CC|nr:hypothetical protein [Klebsiella michiganensis]NRG24622.1 hypothetical protein [Klebsiella michiganensis]